MLSTNAAVSITIPWNLISAHRIFLMRHISSDIRHAFYLHAQPWNSLQLLCKSNLYSGKDSIRGDLHNIRCFSFSRSNNVSNVTKILACFPESNHSLQAVSKEKVPVEISDPKPWSSYQGLWSTCKDVSRLYIIQLDRTICVSARAV